MRPRPIHGDRITLYIERDDDCDCPWWLRWRIVAFDWRVLGPDQPVEQTLAHTRTKLGARWKRRKLAREVLSEDDILV